MDRNVGLILDALDRSGHADDTLVIFHSDHGYLLGHHGGSRSTASSRRRSAPRS
jgi:arylsulfatase A-like enzyme